MVSLLVDSLVNKSVLEGKDGIFKSCVFNKGLQRDETAWGLGIFIRDLITRKINFLITSVADYLSKQNKTKNRPLPQNPQSSPSFSRRQHLCPLVILPHIKPSPCLCLCTFPRGTGKALMSALFKFRDPGSRSNPQPRKPQPVGHRSRGEPVSHVPRWLIMNHMCQLPQHGPV